MFVIGAERVGESVILFLVFAKEEIEEHEHHCHQDDCRCNDYPQAVCAGFLFRLGLALLDYQSNRQGAVPYQAQGRSVPALGFHPCGLLYGLAVVSEALLPDDLCGRVEEYKRQCYQGDGRRC